MNWDMCLHLHIWGLSGPLYKTYPVSFCNVSSKKKKRGGGEAEGNTIESWRPPSLPVPVSTSSFQQPCPGVQLQWLCNTRNIPRLLLCRAKKWRCWASYKKIAAPRIHSTGCRAVPALWYGLDNSFGFLEDCCSYKPGNNCEWTILFVLGQKGKREKGFPPLTWGRRGIKYIYIYAKVYFKPHILVLAAQ